MGELQLLLIIEEMKLFTFRVFMKIKYLNVELYIFAIFKVNTDKIENEKL